MDVTTFTTAVLLGLAVYTAQNLVRYIKAKDLNGILGILLAWLGGFAVAEWASHASITANLVLVDGAGPLGGMDVGSLALLGLGLGSAATGFADHLAARDNTQSAAKPNLVGGGYQQE